MVVDDPRRWARDPGVSPPEFWPAWAVWRSADLPSPSPPPARPSRPRHLLAAAAALALVAVTVALLVWQSSRGDAAAAPTSTTTTTTTSSPAAAAAPPGESDFPVAQALSSAVAVISGSTVSSGFVWDEQGHVLALSEFVSGSSVALLLADGRQVPATVVSADAVLAVTVLAADPALLAASTQPLPRSASRPVQLGEEVFRVAPPLLGDDPVLSMSASAPVVAGRSPPRLVWSTSAGQDLPVFAGSPVVDSAGVLVGMAALSEDGAVVFQDGVMLSRRVAALLTVGPQPAGSLGVDLLASTSVRSVSAGAQDAGLLPGDVLLSIGGIDVPSSLWVDAVASQALAGDELDVVFARAGVVSKVAVTVS